MRKILLASVAVLALGASLPAYAQDAVDTKGEKAGAVVGGTAGAVTGGTIGFFLGGPVGAVIGGFTGAAIGGAAGVSAASVDYAANNPVDTVILDGDIDVGYVVPEDVLIAEVPDDPKYGYIYANNRVYIVDRDTREVVHSPGFLIPNDVVAYVEANPVDDVTFDGELAAGVEFTGDLIDIPDNTFYGYIYVNGRPALVEKSTHRIVWVG
jgi:hypothetical protein